jgi:signal transduction histidine kinase
MKLRSALFFLVLLPFACFADITDSLLHALKSTTVDTQKVHILHELCLSQDEPQTVERYARQMLDISLKASYPKGIIWGYNSLGSLSKTKGDYQAALNYHQKALEILKKEKDELGIAKVVNNIGEAYRLMGNYPKALENYFTSLRTLERLDKQKLVAISLSNIAIIYRQQNNNQMALEYNEKSLKIRRKINDRSGMAVSLDNIGIIYYNLKKTQEALGYALQAIDIREDIKDTLGLASSYNNTSNIYSDAGDFRLALEYQHKSLAMREYLGDPRGIAMSYNNLGNIYLLMNEPAKAESYQNRSLEIAKKLGSPELLRNSYESLVKLHKAKNDYRQAMQYQEMLEVMRDSLMNSERSKQIAELHTKYETEKKDLELNKQALELSNSKLEIAKSRTQRNSLLAGIVLILLIGYLLYNRHKLRQRELLQIELLRQQDLRTKAIIEAEEKERTRIAQELHDGIGQQLSAVKMNMSSLQSSLLQNDDQKQVLDNIMTLVDESVKEVRSVSHNMMPNALLKTGLAGAVREFLNRLGGGRLKIELEIHGLTERLESTTEAILFRVLQEIVNNIIKHADASVVNIQLSREGNEISLIVEDNGKGFDTSAESEGIGLKNIRSRVEYLGGTVHFDSRPGHGTTISVEVPL